MKSKVYVSILLLGIINFGIISIGGCSEKGATKTQGLDLKPAPEFALLDTNGMEQKLSDFKGKVIILDFWATWCPPCREEIPHFIDIYDRYKDRGLEVIGIALDEDKEKVKSFVKDKGINYPVLLGNGQVTDLYGGIDGIPTTFVLDRDGNIRKKYIGYREREVFESDVQELL